MKILRIQMSLRQAGFLLLKHEIEVKESNKSFIWRRRRFFKDQLLIPDTIFRNELPGTMIAFGTICLPEDENKAIKLLKDKIRDRYSELKDCMDALTEGIQKDNIIKDVNDESE